MHLILDQLTAAHSLVDGAEAAAEIEMQEAERQSEALRRAYGQHSMDAREH